MKQRAIAIRSIKTVASTIMMSLAVIMIALPRAIEASTPRHPAQEFKDSLLLVSTDGALEDRWYNTPSESGPNMHTTSSVVRNQYFGIYIAFGGYGREKDGLVRVRYDITLGRPDGTPYHEQKDLGGYEGKVSDGAGVLLSSENLHVCFEPEDPLGTYSIAVVVRDLVTGTKLERSTTIDLVEVTEGDDFDDAEELGDWFMGYFDKQEPLRAVKAFLTSRKLGLWDDEGTADIQAVFFHEIFEQNHWLYPVLAAKYESQDAKTQAAILELMAHGEYEAKDVTLPLSKDDARAFERLRKKPQRDVLEDPITDATHLDMLWGMFFATGKFAPIQRIVSALELAEPESEDSADENPPTSPDDPRILRAAALWSIESNAAHFQLVRDYCQAILEREKLSDHARKDLEAALPE